MRYLRPCHSARSPSWAWTTKLSWTIRGEGFGLFAEVASRVAIAAPLWPGTSSCCMRFASDSTAQVVVRRKNSVSNQRTPQMRLDPENLRIAFGLALGRWKRKAGTTMVQQDLLGASRWLVGLMGIARTPAASSAFFDSTGGTGLASDGASPIGAVVEGTSSSRSALHVATSGSAGVNDAG